MTSKSNKPPFASYRGDEPYIFICYAHSNSAEVYRDLEWLHQQGINIWYDEGIRPGRQWREDIADAINNCSLFLVFLSHESADSYNCKKEISYATQEEKELLAVYIDEVELSPGIALAIGDMQALLRHELSLADYEEKLFTVANRCLTGKKVDLDLLEHTKEPEKPAKWKMFLLALIFISILVLAFWRFSFESNDSRDIDRAADFTFQARDWVLLNFQNQTSNSLFEGSLETALRVALRQSAYINLLSPSRIRESLKRMNRPVGERLDTGLAIELALREGLAAVVETNISGRANDYLLTASVLDPNSGQTVFTRSVRADDEGEVLPKITFLAEAVRDALGESGEDILENNTPLSQATTSNLEALKIYSDAVNNLFVNSHEDTIEQLKQAIKLDPDFALAHSRIATSLFDIDRDLDLARRHWEIAVSQFDRLTQRERLYIDASRAWLGSPAEMERRWQLMARIYPDDIAANHNLGIVKWQYQNDYEAAIDWFRKTIEIEHGLMGITYYFLGYSLLGSGQTAQSIKAFETAKESTSYVAGLADAYIVEGMHEKAIDQLVVHEGLSLNEQIPRLTRLVAIDVDLGNLTTAYDLAGEGLRISRDARSNLSEMGFTGAQLAISQVNDNVEFSEKLDDTVELIRALIAGGELWRYPTRELALTGKMAARQGYPDQAVQLLDMITQNDSHEGYPMSRDYQDLLAGELALALGDIESAMAHFNKVSNGSNLFQVHESLARAYAAQSNAEMEKQELEWLVNHKGQALAEISLSVFGREMNLLDIAAASQRLKTLRQAPQLAAE